MGEFDFTEDRSKPKSENKLIQFTIKTCSVFALLSFLIVGVVMYFYITNILSVEYVISTYIIFYPCFLVGLTFQYKLSKYNK